MTTPTIGRNSLPQEFLDLTSARMLVQPEPQYLFARLVKMGWAQAELRAQGAMLGSSPERAVPSHGAPVPGLDSNQLVLSDAVRGDAIIVDPQLYSEGPSKIGHSLRFNRPIFTNTTYTEASRLVDSVTAISTTGISLTAEQVSITTRLVVGPYDQANSRVAPYPVFVFDAERSLHSMADFVGLNLARDRDRYLDTVIAAYYAAGTYYVYPGDPANALTTANSAFAAAGDRPMDVETIFRAEEKLQSANVPRFSNGKYMLVLHPVQVRQLRSDPEFSRNAVFQADKNPLSQSFVAQIGTGVEVYYSTTVPTGTANSTITYYKGSMFGPGAVGYAPAMECHVRAAAEDNYGLTPKVIWAAGEGHSALDARFICNLFSD